MKRKIAAIFAADIAGYSRLVAEDEEETPKRAETGLTGWIDCYPKSRLTGTLFCGGVNDAREIEGNPKLQAAYEMGKSI